MALNIAARRGRASRKPVNAMLTPSGAPVARRYLRGCLNGGRMMRAAMFLAAFLLTANAATAADAPVEVMVIGTFHMANPGRDLHDVKVPDVLLPAYQAQIENIAKNLARFHPTVIDLEWPKDVVDKRYARYLAGTLKPSRDECVQLGFRLGRMENLTRVNGIDVGGDFPYAPVQAFAKAHGQEKLLDDADAAVGASVDRLTAMIQSSGIEDTLRFMNRPEEIERDNSFYPLMLHVGAGDDQPGAALLAAWYGRNLRICANIVQHARPGDHVVVLYGSGHAHLLRQCISEQPGFKLIEADDYL
jgi:Family of unknown function (DUF5694)